MNSNTLVFPRTLTSHKFEKENKKHFRFKNQRGKKIHRKLICLMHKGLPESFKKCY